MRCQYALGQPLNGSLGDPEDVDESEAPWCDDPEAAWCAMAAIAAWACAS